MKIKIDKSVPIPPSRKDGYNDWPLGEMAIGDSFAITAESSDALISRAQKLRQAASWFARRNPEFKFLTRKRSNGKTTEVRIWRIKVEQPTQ